MLVGVASACSALGGDDTDPAGDLADDLAAALSEHTLGDVPLTDEAARAAFTELVTPETLSNWKDQVIQRPVKENELLSLEMFRKQFTYPVYQNGIEAQARGLSDETLKQAATVAPGRYLNDIVEVVRTGRDKEQRIFLFYDNSSIDKKMMLKNYFTSFADLFVKIHQEMAARGIAPIA